VFGETTFRNPDPTQQSIGRQLLDERDAVVILPRSPLVAGRSYTASVTADGVTYTWTFTVSSPGVDPVPGVDTDGDQLPDPWETRFGLNAQSGTAENGAAGDPDGDGRPNLREYREGTHPRGAFTRYLAEGAASSFFDLSLALANPGEQTANVIVRFLKSDATTFSHTLTLPPLSRRTIHAGDFPAVADAEFSTVIESDVEIVADRTMKWDANGYGSHAETSVVSPSTIWYLAEGATHSRFNLFYLIQNANDAETFVTVKYLLPSPAPPILKTYLVRANSRFNIWLNDEARTDARLAPLAAAEISAVITATLPVIVERAMYRDTLQLFGAGHESAGVVAPSTTWYFAEGATGAYFDLFLLFANPAAQAAELVVSYLLPSGATIEQTYLVPAESRRTVWVDLEHALLADTAVSTLVTSTNGVAIVAERAMWWPGPTPEHWFEAHNSPGVTTSGTKWALAEGEVDAATGTETYILIANTSPFSGEARVLLLFEDGATVERRFQLRPTSRFNVAVGVEFPESSGKRFGAVVESLGPVPAQIVVERAMYSDSAGERWSAGSNAVGTRLR
jgi:hypothetical protein